MITNFSIVAKDDRMQINDKFNQIVSKIDYLKNKRNQLVHSSKLTEDEKNFLETYIKIEEYNESNIFLKDDKVNIKRKLNQNDFDFEMVKDIFEIREELVDMEIEDLSINNIESSYIFESTFFADVLDDVNFAKKQDLRKKRDSKSLESENVYENKIKLLNTDIKTTFDMVML
ncbi:pathogenicity island protein [Mammaliicoccus sciuri]|uniref:pathogenicity island protein n=1 Tax=Mammaliicoccus sciuri TaxID=1296 RepID=UPI0021D3DC37|nr:pathogenicity island protein [Mammaliicoccus sciuri]UXV29416.1 pathogenicity island protein [Mammaliicoccus sciuri]